MAIGTSCEGLGSRGKDRTPLDIVNIPESRLLFSSGKKPAYLFLHMSVLSITEAGINLVSPAIIKSISNGRLL